MPQTAYTILILSTVVSICVSQRCPFLVVQAERDYYNSAESQWTCNDMQSTQHGHQYMHKCNYLARRSLLESASTCEGLCTYHEEGVSHRMKRQVVECLADGNRLNCASFAKYRAIDGSCNNLGNDQWGRSNLIQNRFVPADYDDDMGSPRSKSCNGTLPSARQISNILHMAAEEFEEETNISMFVMQWGQFIAHDIVLTPIVSKEDGMELKCCGADMANPECAPITVPADDKKFTPGGCINFARSVSRKDCNGTRQQVNSQTSYVDASQVYGANLMDNRRLRDFVNGTLKMNLERLPVDFEDSSCRLNGPLDPNNLYCGRAGDIRVNEQPGLAAIHTLFVREHNRIAKALQRVNPHWTDNCLFEEARKIVAAEVQLITYDHWLPSILSPETILQYDLNVSHDSYSTVEDATIKNAFAAAILRFGHSLVNRKIGQVSKLYDEKTIDLLENTFFNPSLYHKFGARGLEYLLRWTALTKSAKSDKKLENSIRNELFKDDMGDSFDLAALNIQRGRDHGLPGYNTFRRYCGLSQATSFSVEQGGLVDHTQECADMLKSAYACVEDIDLFTGAMSEKRVPNSILGPLQQCLLGVQFRSLKVGDRFFFNRPGTTEGFAAAKLEAIKRIRLSHIYCANTDSVFVQQNMFQVPERVNTTHIRLRLCRSLPQINFNLWRERRIG